MSQITPLPSAEDWRKDAKISFIMILIVAVASLFWQLNSSYKDSLNRSEMRGEKNQIQVDTLLIMYNNSQRENAILVEKYNSIIKIFDSSLNKRR